MGIEPRPLDPGEEVSAFVGYSIKKSESELANLEDAIHSAALEAAHRGHRGEKFKVASIAITLENPHITTYKVIITPTSG